jgi:hypothetical protein
MKSEDVYAGVAALIFAIAWGNRFDGVESVIEGGVRCGAGESRLTKVC